MKYKVERCLECPRAWVVLDHQGHLMDEQAEWELAMASALSLYYMDLTVGVRLRVQVDDTAWRHWKPGAA